LCVAAASVVSAAAIACVADVGGCLLSPLSTQLPLWIALLLHVC
jgi:hypothetical protein